MKSTQGERLRIVPSHVSLVLGRSISEELRAYSRALGEKLNVLFPTLVNSSVDRARAALLHFQCERDAPLTHLKAGSVSHAAYAVATVHSIPNVSHVGDFLDALDGVVVHSRVVQEALSGITDAQITLMPLAYDDFPPMPRDAARTRLRLPTDRKIVLCLGQPGSRDAFRDVMAVASKMPDVMFATNARAQTRSFSPFTPVKDSPPTNMVSLEMTMSEERLQVLTSACDALLVTRASGACPALSALQKLLGAGKPVIRESADPSLIDLGDGVLSLTYFRENADSLDGALRSVLEDECLATALGDRARSYATQNSWDALARRHITFYGSLIGDFFGEDWYDEEYYAGARGGKEFFSSGKSEHWSYFNPQGEWTGARTVMEAVKSVLAPRNMLSVGEGRGTFVAYASDVGIAAKGIDFSRWAVDHPYPRAKGMLEWGDARDLSRFPDDCFDIVFASDLMEHVYIEDLERVISEIQRVSRRWAFYNNGGTELGTLPPTFIRKGELPPKELQGTAIAGHVILQPCSWWAERLAGGRWRLRPDLVAGFREAVNVVDPRILGNWKCVIIVEKLLT